MFITIWKAENMKKILPYEGKIPFNNSCEYFQGLFLDLAKR